MTIQELIKELQKFPPDMEVMCEANVITSESDTLFNVCEVDLHDISTFGYKGSEHLVCRIQYNVL